MPENKPWKSWLPGILSNNQLRELCSQGLIDNVEKWDMPFDNEENPIDGSAIDLTLSAEARKMTCGSVKPFGELYIHSIQKQGLCQKMDDNGEFILKRRETYLFTLKEKLRFKKDAQIYGQATAKSTIGRVDVLARLIVDGMDEYEGFDPEGIGNGDMYLEITPMTFDVKVKPRLSLSQLRLFRGSPQNAEIRGTEVCESLLHRDDGKDVDGSLSVDLTPTTIDGRQVCAFQAELTEHSSPIELWRRDYYDPSKYWKPLFYEEGRLQIAKTNFYILRSKEMISVDPAVAVYCKATDEALGEMRIHYAGFVHPYFGKERQDGKPGTPLIFEVRGHDVDVCLRDSEKMAKLIFYRMSEVAERGKKSYNEQSLNLSAIFKPW